MGSHGPTPPSRDFAGAEAMGRDLANSTRTALSNLATSAKAELSFLGLTFDLPEPHLRVAEKVRLRPWVARYILPASPSSYLQTLRLNDFFLVTTPADFSGELALPLKEFVAPGKLAASSFNGDYVGYVVPSDYYNLDAYETRVMSWFGPSLPDYMDDLIRRMLGAVSAD